MNNHKTKFKRFDKKCWEKDKTTMEIFSLKWKVWNLWGSWKRNRIISISISLCLIDFCY